MGPHNETVIGVRATTARRDLAHEALHEHGWKLQEFVTACLEAVIADPAKFLRHVARHRPERKAAGRPRKRQPDA
jgi:hypothetical protein